MLRIDSGRFAVHLERHPLTRVVSATLKQFEERLDGRQVVEQVPGDLTVEADPHLLALALRQLLDNALKYSPPTSAIDIMARANGAIEIDVHNTGSLIPEAEQPRIFERYYRGTQARQIPGTGMGLAIVQRIAEAHGGTLRVTSSPQTGTTFTLSLPHAAATR
jgi:signal transduction histidine kinase